MKRILSVILCLSCLLLNGIPAHAQSKDETKYPLSENLIQYLKSDESKLLTLHKNYGYMSFAENFQTDKCLQTLAKAADFFVGTGTEPDEEKYLEVLIILYALQEQENAADMSAQKKLDNQKAGANYVAEITAAAADTAAAWFGASMPTDKTVNLLSTILGGASATSKNLDITLDVLSDLEVLVKNYADYDVFLAVIEENADGALKTAATKLRAEMMEMMDLRLTTYDWAAQASANNLSEYLMSDWFIDECKNLPEYRDNAQMQNILKVCSDMFKLKQAWDAGTAIGMLVADAAIGGEKLINRLHEIIALYEISLILQEELSELNSEFLNLYASDESDRLADRYILCSNYLIVARLRGEYCLYSVVATDAGILGWLQKESREAAAEWYEKQRSRILEINKSVKKINYFNEVETVDFEMVYGPMQYAMITALDRSGNIAWTYETAKYEPTELRRVSEIGIYKDTYYFIEDGSVVACDLSDGSLRWKTDAFGGASAGFAFGSDGTLYLCGYYGPDFFAVDTHGNVLCRIFPFDDEYFWPYKVEAFEDFVLVTFEGSLSGEYGDETTFSVNLKDYSYEKMT